MRVCVYESISVGGKWGGGGGGGGGRVGLEEMGLLLRSLNKS